MALAATSIFDVMKPAYYALEKHIASGMIPRADTEGRLTLDTEAACRGADFDHSDWDALLKAHVKPDVTIGRVVDLSAVDYDALAGDKRFARYLAQLARADVASLSPAGKLALFLNAYNALAIKKVTDALQSGNSIASINELSSKKQQVWDQPAGVVGGEELSLNAIEHDKLRRTWAEPAVHACIVCASASCPNLRAEAYVAQRLREQMRDQCSAWVSSSTKGLLFDAARSTLYLSRIFLWFEDDFGGRRGVIDFVAAAMRDREQAAAVRAARRLTVRYFEYSWELNSVR